MANGEPSVLATSCQGNLNSILFSPMNFLRNTTAVFASLLFFSVSTEAKIIAGPYLQNPRSTTITIRWISDDGGKSIVHYGADLKLVAAGPNGIHYVKLGSYLHEVAITGLQPNTRYVYRANSNNTLSDQYSFKTAPPAGSPISFLAISDAQMKPDLPMTIAVIGKLVQPDLIIFSGDLVDEPDRVADWYGAERSFFDVLTGRQPGAPLLQNIPLFPSLGNHEYGEKERPASYLDETESLQTYTSLFNLPGNERYYSHDYGNVHFIHLNIARQWTSNAAAKPQWILGEAITPGSAQYQWLMKDLAQKKQPWTVVSFHHPMLGQGHNISPFFCDPVKKADGAYDYPRDVLYNDLRPLFEKHGVNLVVWGHSHAYEHYYVNGIHYVEASSIGNTYGFAKQESHGLTPVYQNSEDRSFAFVQTSDAKMVVTTYRAPGGKILESFEIRRTMVKTK
jgi:predicted phosphodiesterase